MPAIHERSLGCRARGMSFFPPGCCKNESAPTVRCAPAESGLAAHRSP